MTATRESRRAGACVRLVSAAAAALVIGAAGAGPVAVFDEISYDAGQVRHGAVVTHDFVVRNAGDAPLHVLEATPSCVCTSADFDATIQPRTAGKIRVVLRTGDVAPGRLSKTVNVTTDAPGLERVVLQVKVAAVGAVEFLPHNPVYLVVERGRARQERVLLRVHEPGLAISGVSSSSASVRAALAPVRVDPAERPDDAVAAPRAGDLWITLEVAPDAPAGRQKVEIAVKTRGGATVDPLLVELVVKAPAEKD